MLAKPRRLRRRFEIEAVLKKGRRLRGQYLLGVVRERPRGGLARVTVVVNTKFDKRAVVRNRYKRMLRSDLAGYINKLRDGFDLLIMIKQKTAQNNHEVLTADLDSLITKGGLLK